MNKWMLSVVSFVFCLALGISSLLAGRGEAGAIQLVCAVVNLPGIIQWIKSQRDPTI